MPSCKRGWRSPGRRWSRPAGSLVGGRVQKKTPSMPGCGSAGSRERHFHTRSEEHTSELQSRENIVCRLWLEKKKTSPDDLRWMCNSSDVTAHLARIIVLSYFPLT